MAPHLDSASIPRLASPPERIFISVDASTGKSTLSYAPAGAGAPVTVEDDPRGELALKTARAIVAAYPACAVTGPHFFESSKGRPRRGRPRR